MKSLMTIAMVAGLTFIASASAQSSSHVTRSALLSPETASPQLVCQVYPYPNAPSSNCYGPVPSGSYEAAFNVLNLPAGNYAYSWNIPSQARITGLIGCTSGANCTVAFRASGNDFEETVTVTVTETSTGQQYVLPATITEAATCNGGGTLGYHFC